MGLMQRASLMCLLVTLTACYEPPIDAAAQAERRAHITGKWISTHDYVSTMEFFEDGRAIIPVKRSRTKDSWEATWVVLRDGRIQVTINDTRQTTVQIFVIEEIDPAYMGPEPWDSWLPHKAFFRVDLAKEGQLAAAAEIAGLRILSGLILQDENYACLDALKSVEEAEDFNVHAFNAADYCAQLPKNRIAYHRSVLARASEPHVERMVADSQSRLARILAVHPEDSWIGGEEWFDPVEALELAEKSFAVQPENCRSQDALALSYAANGDFASAVRVQEEAIGGGKCEHFAAWFIESLEWYKKGVTGERRSDKQ